MGKTISLPHHFDPQEHYRGFLQWNFSMLSIRSGRVWFHWIWVFWVVLTSSLQSSVVWAFLRELSSVLTGSAIHQSTTLTITKPAASKSAFKSRSIVLLCSCRVRTGFFFQEEQISHKFYTNFWDFYIRHNASKMAKKAQ